MTAPRVSVWILGDQLLKQHPALSQAEEQTTGDQIQVVMVESTARRHKLPYHRKKLVLLLSAMRHYAGELRERGYTVDYVQAPTFTAGLRQHVARHQPERLLTMAASHYAGREFQMQRLSDLLGVAVNVVPNSQFLVELFDPYPDADTDKRVVQEHFYRAMRQRFDVLMEPNGEPAGGQWNYDKQNRQRLSGAEQPPAPPHFEPDDITRKVMGEIEEEGHGVGSVQDFGLAVTRRLALAAFGNFVAHRLHDFGPFEDAMSSQHRVLWHSALSPYLNIGLLEPLELAQAVERAYREGRAPINSAEGFVRQVLGWREFMYWQYWRRMPAFAEENFWDAHRPLPEFFWTGETDMNCMVHVLRRTLEAGYNHHIERLMVLSNFCTSAGIQPMAVNDWFLALYVDAYEWVMLPNVIGMGLNADGGKTATKPYISTANYINKMSDYCTGCHYNHKLRTGPNTCPFNFLYWNFLIDNEETLQANPRMGPAILGLRHVGDAERPEIQRQAKDFLEEVAGSRAPVPSSSTTAWRDA